MGLALSPPSILVLLSLLAMANMGTGKISQNFKPGESLSFVGSSEEFKGQLGGEAYLECSIMNLSNMSMAWVRMRDSHILTVDRETFIQDRR